MVVLRGGDGDVLVDAALFHGDGRDVLADLEFDGGGRVASLKGLRVRLVRYRPLNNVPRTLFSRSRLKSDIDIHVPLHVRGRP